jgi:(p)ppGpp synthase/HD superfamily hydrolase
MTGGVRTTTSSHHLFGFRFEMALLYAARLHSGQTRKSGAIPYVGHLLGVASTVIEAGGDEDQAIAALLHDAIEDQGATADEILRLFGSRVARIVVSVSEIAPNGGAHTAENWRARKEQYLAHLGEANRDTLLVSLADKLYNARSILHALLRDGPRVWDQFHQPRGQQLWFYRALLAAYQTDGAADLLGPASTVLVRELETVVKELEASG